MGDRSLFERFKAHIRMLEIKHGLAMSGRNQAEREVLRLKEEIKKLEHENKELEQSLLKSRKKEMSYRTPHRKFRRRRKIGSTKRKNRRLRKNKK